LELTLTKISQGGEDKIYQKLVDFAKAVENNVDHAECIVDSIRYESLVMAMVTEKNMSSSSLFLHQFFSRQ